MSIVIASPIHQVLSSKKQKTTPCVGLSPNSYFKKKNMFIIMISIKMARHAEKSCVMHIYICTYTIYIYTHTYVCVCIVMHFISYWFLHHAKRPQATWHHRLRRRWIQEIKVHQIVDAQLFQGQHLNLGRSFRDPSLRRLPNFRFGRVEKKTTPLLW